MRSSLNRAVAKLAAAQLIGTQLASRRRRGRAPARSARLSALAATMAPLASAFQEVVADERVRDALRAAGQRAVVVLTEPQPAAAAGLRHPGWRLARRLTIVGLAIGLGARAGYKYCQKEPAIRDMAAHQRDALRETATHLKERVPEPVAAGVSAVAHRLHRDGDGDGQDGQGSDKQQFADATA